MSQQKMTEMFQRKNKTKKTATNTGIDKG